MAMDMKINHDTNEVEIRFNDQVLKRHIRKNESGQEFFHVPNLLNNPKKVPNQLFHYRIKDAVETIRSGDADELLSVKRGFESVIRYIDREHGEKIRKQSIEKWKDAKFAYMILVSNSFYIDINGNISPEPYLFDTQEQVEEYLHNVFKKMASLFYSSKSVSNIRYHAFFCDIFSDSDYSFIEKEYLHYLLEKTLTGSANFPIKIAQITF